jgi:ankyrin repeat protein
MLCRQHHVRNITLVELLLEKGAEVNAQGGHWGGALPAASSGGYETVVRLLLEKGAEVNVPGGWFGHALETALRSKHHGVVALLLENGARS